jgi:hypothetical protein
LRNRNCIEFIQLILNAPTVEGKDILRKLINSNNFNWQQLIEISRSNGLLPLIYFKLKNYELFNEIPEDIIPDLEFFYKQSALLSLKKKAVFIEIAEIFKNLNIPFITLKGMFLEQTIYEQSGLRPMIDIDVLVPEEMLKKVICELIEKGATQIPIYETEWIASFSHQARPIFFKEINIELHRNIVDSFDNWQLKTADVWNYVQPVTLSNIQTNTFKTEFLIIYLCHHVYNTIKGGRVKLISYYDIFKIIEKEEINWIELNELVLKYNIEKSVYHSLGFVYFFFHTSKISDNLKSKFSIYCTNPNLVLDIIETGEAKTYKEHYIEKFNRITGFKGKLLYLFGKIWPDREFVIYNYKILRKNFLVFAYFNHILKLLLNAFYLVIDFFIPKTKRNRKIG